MSHQKKVSDIRRGYGRLELSEGASCESPIAQFQAWFENAITSETEDPTAMVLSTVDAKGRPDSRVVLLKAVEDDNFVFYTNYHSTKGKQLLHNPHVALNFYWPHLARQIRIRGVAQKIPAYQSDAYFSSRPLASQYSAVISQQSTPIPSRKDLEDKLCALISAHTSGLTVERPEHWGGYSVSPCEIEFWQGRDNRLHDRVQYVFEQRCWQKRRLAP